MKVHQAYLVSDDGRKGRVRALCGVQRPLKMTLNMRVTCKRCRAVYRAMLRKAET
jgi:hypothetical protein